MSRTETKAPRAAAVEKLNRLLDPTRGRSNPGSSQPPPETRWSRRRISVSYWPPTGPWACSTRRRRARRLGMAGWRGHIDSVMDVVDGNVDLAMEGCAVASAVIFPFGPKPPTFCEPGPEARSLKPFCLPSLADARASTAATRSAQCAGCDYQPGTRPRSRRGAAKTDSPAVLRDLRCSGPARVETLDLAIPLLHCARLGCR